MGSIRFVHAPSAHGTLPSEHRMQRGSISLERKISQHFGTRQGTYKANGINCVPFVADRVGQSPSDLHHLPKPDIEAEEEAEVACASCEVAVRSEEDAAGTAGPARETGSNVDAAGASAGHGAAADPEEDAAPGIWRPST